MQLPPHDPVIAKLTKARPQYHALQFPAGGIPPVPIEGGMGVRDSDRISSL